jgi:hypothetical protein
MKHRHRSITLAFFGLAVIVAAQAEAQTQWAGSLDGTGPISRTGDVAIGYATAYAKLFVAGPAGGTAFLTSDLSNSTFAIGHQATPLPNTVFARGTAGSNLFLGANETGVVMINTSGNVGIGMTNPLFKLDVNGTIRASGVIGATYQDLAEWVPASGNVPPGTVVILNSEKNNEVMPSMGAYDTRVAGVVSARPGLLLGEEGASKAMVATTGRVKVRVDATKHPIHIGDLLVTSDTPGTAMKSEPLDLGGVKIHRPGTLIGKALEPLPGGQGEILVLLSLQ